MRSIDLNPRRIEGLRSRLFGGRASVQVIVGAIAIAAIVLAFVFRPGQTTEQQSGPTSTAAKPTAALVTPAAVAAPAPTKVATQPAPPPAKESVVHTVGSGDTLSKIAEKYYSDASKWNKIYDANRDVLQSPDSLQVGQKLKIPE